MHKPATTLYAPGVSLVQSVWVDEYLGSLEALVAAGLVQADRVPGAPGQNKVSIMLRPDGQPRSANKRGSRAGCKRITRRGKAYEVTVWVSDEVAEARLAQHHAQEALHRAQQQPAANADVMESYKEGYGVGYIAGRHGFPQRYMSTRPRPVLPEGWRVIQGGRHA